MTDSGHNSGTFIIADDGASYFIPTSALAPYQLSDADSAELRNRLGDASDEVSGFGMRGAPDSFEHKVRQSGKEISFNRSLSVKTKGPIIMSGTSGETIMDWPDLY